MIFLFFFFFPSPRRIVNLIGRVLLLAAVFSATKTGMFVHRERFVTKFMLNLNNHRWRRCNFFEKSDLVFIVAVFVLFSHSYFAASSILTCVSRISSISSYLRIFYSIKWFLSESPYYPNEIRILVKSLLLELLIISLHKPRKETSLLDFKQISYKSTGRYFLSLIKRDREQLITQKENASSQY